MKLFRTLSILFALVAVPTIASASNGDSAAKPAPSARVSVRDHRDHQARQVGPRRTPAQRGAMKITKLDKNADGTLSIREVKGTRLEARFGALDTNSDRQLSKAELRVGMQKHQGMKKGEGKGMGKGKGKGQWHKRGAKNKPGRTGKQS